MYRKEVVKRDQSKGQCVCAGEGRQSGDWMKKTQRQCKQSHSIQKDKWQEEEEEEGRRRGTEALYSISVLHPQQLCSLPAFLIIALVSFGSHPGIRDERRGQRGRAAAASSSLWKWTEQKQERWRRLDRGRNKEEWDIWEILQA